MPLIQPAAVLLRPHSPMKPGSRAGKVANPVMPRTPARQSVAVSAMGEAARFMGLF